VKKYKALFLDVDGTTVVHGMDNLPSARVTEAIAACSRQGVSVNIATSRPPRAAVRILEHLQLSGYGVLSSGSQIYDAKTKQIVIEKQLPPDAVEKILAIARKHKEKALIYNGEHEITYDPQNPPEKVVGIYFPKLHPDTLPVISKEVTSVPGVSVHRMESWDDGFECLDIINKDASKLHGIVEVTKLLRINTQDIIGVGDGYNDFPLLLACGLKIAMGNAVPELKAIADFVAPSVEVDGVATVIEKFILY